MDAKKTIDNVAGMLQRVSELEGHDVLVGIPADKAGRKGDPVNNATLAYVHEFGSPAHNIPARPFLYPGILKAKNEIVAALRKGAQDVLHGGSAMAVLNKVGLMARNSVVREITAPDPEYAPLKPATIRARLRRTKAGQRQLRKIRADRLKAGVSAGTALTQWAEAGNIRPLIDTGQLRAAITYVIRRS